MANTTDRLRVGNQIGIYALMMSMFGNAAITPALGALQATYPDSPAYVITLIGTLPSLFVIFGALITGAIVGKFIKYKTLGLIALFFYGLFGVIPFWIHPSLEVVLVFRALNGLANGLLFPLASATILRFVQDKGYRATYLGRAQSLGSGGSIILTIAGGYLGAVSGIHTFLVYGLAFVCFLLVVALMKEPPSLDEVIAKNPEYKEDAINAKRVKLPAVAWIFVLLFFVFYGLGQNPLFMTVPLSLPPEDAGNIGLIFSLMTVASFLIAFVTDRFIKIFKRFTGSFFFVLGGLGAAFVAFSDMNLTFVAIGLFVHGLAIGCFVMTTYENSMLTTPAGMAFIASLTMIASNLGNFLGSFWFGLLGTFLQTASMIQTSTIIMFLIGAILWAVVNMTINKKTWDARDEEMKAAAKE